MKQSILMRVLFCKIHCPSFICFCKPSSAHLYTQGPLKLENTQHIPSTQVVSDRETTTEVKEENSDGIGKDEIDDDERVLKSSIRKHPSKPEIQRKRVQWMDNLGKQLVEVREFESSETGDTDNEEDNRGCVCIIL